LTNAIQEWILRVSSIPVDSTNAPPDVCIVELGGTVGDIESAPFIEAMRQFQFKVGVENFALVYVSLIPVVGGEQKTKPTQAGVRDLRGLGLLPDIVSLSEVAWWTGSKGPMVNTNLTSHVVLAPQIACRCEHELLPATMEKVSMFCHVQPSQVLGVHNVNSTYHVPLLMRNQGLVDFLTKRLKLDEIKVGEKDLKRGANLLSRWKEMTLE
jgi:CTP synthase